MEKNTKTLDMAERLADMNRFLIKDHEDGMIIAIAIHDKGDYTEEEFTVDGNGNPKNIVLALGDVIASFISNYPKPLQCLLMMELNERIIERLKEGAHNGNQ